MMKGQNGVFENVKVKVLINMDGKSRKERKVIQFRQEIICREILIEK